MASEPQRTVTAEQLMALKSGPDPLRAISELLLLKKMGPADHIRTKHKIKSFVETGTIDSAKEIIQLAQRRAVAVGQREVNRISVSGGMRP